MCEIRTYRYQVRAAEDEISTCALTKTILFTHNFWATPYGNSRIGSEYRYVSSWHGVELQVDTDVWDERIASIFVPKRRRKRTVI